MIAAIPTKYALGAYPPCTAEHSACDQGDDRKLCAAGDEGCGHDGHLTVTVILDRSGSHDTRNAAAGTDQHRDEGLTGKAELTEDTVHNECDTSHITAALKECQEQEQD